MKKITFLITLIGISLFAQEQFPGENENNLIINAGFEDNPSWGDEFSIGWRGYNCNRIEIKVSFLLMNGTTYQYHQLLAMVLHLLGLLMLLSIKFLKCCQTHNIL